jgi:hypothetical protein
VAVLFVSYVVFGGWLSLAALSGTDESETYADMWTSICPHDGAAHDREQP